MRLFIEDRSYCFCTSAGNEKIASNIGGARKVVVGFSSSIAFKTSSGWKFSIICKELPTNKFGMEIDKAAAPNNGPTTKPFPLRPIENSILNKRPTIYKLRCDRTAPLGQAGVAPAYKQPMAARSYTGSTNTGSACEMPAIHRSYSKESRSST